MILPTSVDPDPKWRWLDTFDWYSPRYQWKHTDAEVEGGTAVVVDVMRAFTTASWAFELGVERIVLAESLDEALRYKALTAKTAVEE